MPSTSKTKSDLQDEVAELRTKLRDAQSIIAEALGYDTEEEEDVDDDNEDFEDSSE